MKKYFLYTLCLLLATSITTSFAQDTRSDVLTPKGSNAQAWITAENSNYWRNYYDNIYATANRTYVYYFGGSYSSSRRFNCHGYAWHMSEGGSPRWIGYSQTSDEDIYMSDGSYVQVCSETYPGKVSWADGDHSAITTSTAGVVLSKWNQFPLMYHNINDNPFGSSYKYYVSTAISGSLSPLCIANSRTFSVQNISGATYTWTTSSNLSGSSSGNQITVTANSNGAGWVQVQISTPCSPSPATRRVDFTVGVPDTYPYIAAYEDCHQTYTQLSFQVTNPVPDVSYKWGYFGPNDGLPNWTITNSNTAWFVFNQTGSHGIVAMPYNVCGESYYAEYGIEVLSHGNCNYMNSFSVSASPNPTSGDLYVTIGKEKSTTKAQPAIEDVQMQLYDVYRTRLVKQWSFKSNQPNYRLDVRDVKKGQYVLQVKKGKQVQVKHIIVQ